jgi:hypothetical protein
MPLNAEQQRLRRSFERLIGAAAPALDLLLSFGERLSRRAEPVDHDYYPVQLPPPADPEPVPGSTAPPDPPHSSPS